MKLSKTVRQFRRCRALLGQEKNLCFGLFAAVYGLQNTVDMIDGALARSA